MPTPKRLFGFPVVEIENMPEPVIVLTDWKRWTAHRVIDGSGDEIAKGMIQCPPGTTLEQIEHPRGTSHSVAYSNEVVFRSSVLRSALIFNLVDHVLCLSPQTGMVFLGSLVGHNPPQRF